jgi:hypothetical protein
MKDGILPVWAESAKLCDNAPHPLRTSRMRRSSSILVLVGLTSSNVSILRSHTQDGLDLGEERRRRLGRLWCDQCDKAVCCVEYARNLLWSRACEVVVQSNNRAVEVSGALGNPLELPSLALRISRFWHYRPSSTVMFTVHVHTQRGSQLQKIL